MWADELILDSLVENCEDFGTLDEVGRLWDDDHQLIFDSLAATSSATRKRSANSSTRRAGSHYSRGETHCLICNTMLPEDVLGRWQFNITKPNELARWLATHRNGGTCDFGVQYRPLHGRIPRPPKPEANLGQRPITVISCCPRMSRVCIGCRPDHLPLQVDKQLAGVLHEHVAIGDPLKFYTLLDSSAAPLEPPPLQPLQPLQQSSPPASVTRPSPVAQSPPLDGNCSLTAQLNGSDLVAQRQVSDALTRFVVIPPSRFRA